MFRPFNYLRHFGDILRDCLIEVCLQYGLQTANSVVGHRLVASSDVVDSGMNRLSPLFTQEAQSHHLLLQEWNHVILQHVELWCDGGMRKSISIKGEELCDVLIYKDLKL